MKNRTISVLSILLVACSVSATELIWESTAPPAQTGDWTFWDMGRMHVSKSGRAHVSRSYLMTVWWKSFSTDYYRNNIAVFSPTGTLLNEHALPDQRGVDIDSDSQDNYFIAPQGYWENGPVGWCGFTKYSPNGQALWSYEQPGSGYGVMNTALEVDDDGNSYFLRLDETQQPISVRLTSFDPAGQERWTLDFDGSATSLVRLSEDFDGNLVVETIGGIFTVTTEGQQIGSIPGYSWPAPAAAGPDGAVYVIRESSQTLEAIDRTGVKLWQYDGGFTTLRGISADDRYVYIEWGGVIVTMLDLDGNFVRSVAYNQSAFWLFQTDGLGNFATAGNSSFARLTAALGLNQLRTQLGRPSFSFGPRSDIFFTERLPDDTLRVQRYHSGIDHSSATLVRGVTTEHSHYALNDSGDGYWRVRPGITFSTQQAPVSIELNHLAPPTNPSEMGVIVESRATSSSIAQTIEAHNVSTGSWTVLESNASLPSGANPDRYVVVDIANPSEYINANREIKVRISFRQTGPVFSYPWIASIDRQMVRYVR